MLLRTTCLPEMTTMRNTSALLFLVLAIIHGVGCSVAKEPLTSEQIRVNWQESSPPPELQRYQTELFNLLSKEPALISDKVMFDSEFHRAWKRLFSGRDELEKRLLSGPAGEGQYWVRAGEQVFLYDICEAHHCIETGIHLYFRPSTGAIGGRLQDQCKVAWLGDVDAEMKRLVEVGFARSIEARKEECAKHGGI